MGFEFLSWALWYALGKGADRLLKGREGLIARLNDVMKCWAEGLPEGAYVNHEVFFSGVHDEKQCESHPKLKHLFERLKHRDPPEESDWLDAFMEQCRIIPEGLEESQEFFTLTEEEARGHFETLVQEVYQVCISHTEIFRVDSHKRIKRIDEGVTRIEEQLQKVKPGAKRETLWSGERMLGNGPKVIDPFAGRGEELGQLEEAVRGELDSADRAGPGQSNSLLKSCLTTVLAYFTMKLNQTGYINCKNMIICVSIILTGEV